VRQETGEYLFTCRHNGLHNNNIGNVVIITCKVFIKMRSDTMADTNNNIRMDKYLKQQLEEFCADMGI